MFPITTFSPNIVMTHSVDLALYFPGLKYCGPGTNLDVMLETDGATPKPGCEPVDRIDEISRRHCIYYRDHPSKHERLAGDDVMLKELRRLPNPTCRERFERFFVYPLLWIKRQAVALWYLIKR